MATRLLLDGKTEEQVAAVTTIIPLGRLVGPDGGWVNGQVLRANGDAV